ncbi:hypothetical protein FA13DRAFT_1794811 [Coprinellus micaceus]|uniref:Uncharacterized protein n=1 Tax=Coprinellus micaceus TaxID=71717 RepID=A0A4Y7T1A0_COPMI|nr:hypothetical protein FA13DRAFT_1794811 [Coprinellus micaceus]
MHASLIRRSLGGLVPPKVATPGSLYVVMQDPRIFDSPRRLLRQASQGQLHRWRSGIKGKFFNGANASGAPFATLIVVLFGIGYTIDYNMHLKHHKNHQH